MCRPQGCRPDTVCFLLLSLTSLSLHPACPMPGARDPGDREIQAHPCKGREARGSVRLQRVGVGVSKDLGVRLRPEVRLPLPGGRKMDRARGRVRCCSRKDEGQRRGNGDLEHGWFSAADFANCSSPRGAAGRRPELLPAETFPVNLGDMDAVIMVSVRIQAVTHGDMRTQRGCHWLEVPQPT